MLPTDGWRSNNAWWNNNRWWSNDEIALFIIYHCLCQAAGRTLARLRRAPPRSSVRTWYWRGSTNSASRPSARSASHSRASPRTTSSPRIRGVSALGWRRPSVIRPTLRSRHMNAFTFVSRSQLWFIHVWCLDDRRVWNLPAIFCHYTLSQDQSYLHYR